METVKMEVDSKSDVQGVKHEAIEVDAPSGGDLQATEDSENKDTKKSDDTKVKVIPKGAGQAYLTVGEMVVEGDESITMTAEEVRSYIEKSVFDQIVNNNNQLFSFNKNMSDIHAEIKEKRDEFQKLARLIDIIDRDQLKFLRTDKNLRKYLTKTGGVGVELPVLPNSLPDEALLKQGFFSHPSIPTTNKPAPAKTLAPTVPPAPATTSVPATTPVPTTTPVSATAPVFATKSAPVFATKSAPVLATKSATAESLTGNKTQKPAANIECIDLTDESETPSEPVKKNPSSYSFLGLVKHPAPLPPKPFAIPNKDLPPIPPKPRLKISSEERGIVLQWDMVPNPGQSNYGSLLSFDIFGYQEQKNVSINTLLWKKIGSVKAMTLPMACTLTQFIEGNKYHFSIRAVDVHNRCGFYSDPISIVYTQTKS